jgi:hypothetical protein
MRQYQAAMKRKMRVRRNLDPNVMVVVTMFVAEQN